MRGTGTAHPGDTRAAVRVSLGSAVWSHADLTPKKTTLGIPLGAIAELGPGSA